MARKWRSGSEWWEVENKIKSWSLPKCLTHKRACRKSFPILNLLKGKKFLLDTMYARERTQRDDDDSGRFWSNMKKKTCSTKEDLKFKLNKFKIMWNHYHRDICNVWMGKKSVNFPHKTMLVMLVLPNARSKTFFSLVCFFFWKAR